MLLNTFRAGDLVMVTAKDDFYAYIDGWRGRVGSSEGVPGGHVAVEVSDEGLTKRFIVPVDEVALMVGR
jgi:ribosomal protein L21E